MRCTRCDRLAVPQAVARTRGGLVVFGWCLPCLIAEGCVEIEVALKAPGGKAIGLEAARRAIRPAPPDESRVRRRALWAVAAVMGTWSILLVAASAWSAWRPDTRSTSPLGNGVPILLLIGGLGSALVGLVVAATALDRARRVGAVLRALELASSGLALVVLVASILAYDPRRNVWVTAVVVLLLGISAAAIWARRTWRTPRGRRARKQAKRVGGIAAHLEEDEDLEGLL
jgi:hypothetical protein